MMAGINQGGELGGGEGRGGGKVESFERKRRRQDELIFGGRESERKLGLGTH